MPVPGGGGVAEGGAGAKRCGALNSTDSRGRALAASEPPLGLPRASAEGLLGHGPKTCVRLGVQTATHVISTSL